MRGLLEGIRRRWRSARPRPLVLMYHRVATPAVDPWGLAVSPQHFEEQLEVLCRTRVPISMSELVRRLYDGTLPAAAVAVTFDDGYADNLSEAAPRLQRAGVPATLFVATGFLDEQREFWWDELARLLLCGTARACCDVECGGEPSRIAVGARAAVDDSRAWRAWEEPQGDRQRTYVETYARLRASAAEERERVMARLRDAMGPTAGDQDGRPMTRAELGAWAGHPGLEIGAHTVTHPMLTAIDLRQCEREVDGSKEECERLLGHRIDGFAYPHGAHDERVRVAVRTSGLAWGCTTAPRVLTGWRTDPYALPRIAVRDCDGHAFERELMAAGVL